MDIHGVGFTNNICFWPYPHGKSNVDKGLQMTGTFIISLDCEGKWGIADKISEYHKNFFTEDNLVLSYTKLLNLFDRYEMSATFAYVMAFILSEEERNSLGPIFRDVQVGATNWLRHYREAEAGGQLEGWFCPRVFDLTQERQRHEIGCHGFCHLPFAEDLIGLEDAQYELTASAEIAASKGVILETFVYPRNQIGYKQLLFQNGFVGYRDRLKSNPALPERALSLLRELNVFGRAQPNTENTNDLSRIPSGYFFNWRRGLRSAIPHSLTRYRWGSILQDAARNGGVAHLWFHPHNLIDGPTTYEVLEDVLKLAARLRSMGDIKVMTQAEYVRSRWTTGNGSYPDHLSS